MTLEEIKDAIVYGGGWLFIAMTLVQITPVKLNPWTWLGRIIGRAINGEVIEKVNDLTNEVKAIKEEDSEQWASLSRSHILRFGDELLHGMQHSKEHFDQILIDISKYETYCDEHPAYKNNVANATIRLIRDTYQKCLTDNKFL